MRIQKNKKAKGYSPNQKKEERVRIYKNLIRTKQNRKS